MERDSATNGRTFRRGAQPVPRAKRDCEQTQGAGVLTFLLDANSIRYWVKTPNATLRRHFHQVALSDLRISAIVEAELRYGLVKKGITKSKVGVLVAAFLMTVQILPWECSTAQCFARLRTDSEAKGITVHIVDLMVATHAREDGDLTLVTNDGALLRLRPWIKVVDWTK